MATTVSLSSAPHAARPVVGVSAMLSASYVAKTGDKMGWRLMVTRAALNLVDD